MEKFGDTCSQLPWIVRWCKQYLFITHDLSVVRAIADDVAVMQAGKIVERGRTDAVFAGPESAYTARLLAAAPRLTDLG